MTYDLLLRGGRVVTDSGVEPLAVGVADGRIVAIAPEIDGSAREEVDAAGLIIMPGAIDAHVHFNDPGRTDWEGIATGSAALAAGGGTCFFDMPLNASPPTLDGPSFDLKRAAAEGQAATDFGLWGGLVPGPLDRLDELAARGVVGFKAFMSGSGIADFEAVDDLTLFDGMTRAAALGLPVAVHAESDTLTAGLAARARAEGRTGVRDYLACRPVVAELDAIRRAVLFAEETGCALHVVHVSTGRGVALIAEARARGVDVTCETCPHYLVLTEDDMERLGTVAKCAPPLRCRADADDLWVRLLGGDVLFVASDHSPSPPEMKEAPCFFDVWGGIAGCQSTLSLLLTEAHQQRGVPLAQVADWLSRAPAERFGIADKGRVAVGYDADLALVDLEEARELRTDDLLYRHRVSPYVGRPIHGLVRRTLVRGRTVVRDGVPTGERPGRLVRPRARA
ncbi:MAG TPA: allantoinase [Rhodothermales bacterium]|nr:allantoinase [Rhodothermales bacterium]